MRIFHLYYIRYLLSDGRHSVIRQYFGHCSELLYLPRVSPVAYTIPTNGWHQHVKIVGTRMV